MHSQELYILKKKDKKLGWLESNLNLRFKKLLNVIDTRIKNMIIALATLQLFLSAL